MDNDAALREALAEVDRLQETLETIQREIDAKTDISRFEKRVDECRKRWEQDKHDFQAEFDYLVALIVRDRAAEGVRPLLMARQRSDGSEAFTELSKRNPEWRQTLEKACKAKLAIAEAEAKGIEETIQAEFTGGGFSSDDVANHPKVKRSRWQVSIWQSQLTHCTTQDSVALWHSAIRNLKG